MILNGSSFFLYIAICEMDVIVNHPNEFTYDEETSEVESVEEHFSQCALNFVMNISVVGTFVVDSIEDKPTLLVENVYSFGMDNMSYHSIHDGLNQ